MERMERELLIFKGVVGMDLVLIPLPRPHRPIDVYEKRVQVISKCRRTHQSALET